MKEYVAPSIYVKKLMVESLLLSVVSQVKPINKKDEYAAGGEYSQDPFGGYTEASDEDADDITL